MKCNQHPGGPADLPLDNFYPSDHGREWAPCKACRLRTAKERDEAKKNGTYVPKAKTFARKQPQAVATAELVTQPTMYKIGGYYIHHDAILIADTLQDGKVTLYTTILEIDGETKHPRNKKLLFTKQHAPDEYRACLAWLADMAGAPRLETSDNERAAMELADEATKRLAAANKEIADLKSALAPLKALLNGSIKELV